MTFTQKAAKNAVHRAHEFASRRKLKGAEEYINARFRRQNWFHACYSDPKSYAQSWLFEFICKKSKP